MSLTHASILVLDIDKVVEYSDLYFLYITDFYVFYWYIYDRHKQVCLIILKQKKYICSQGVLKCLQVKIKKL